MAPQGPPPKASPPPSPPPAPPPAPPALRPDSLGHSDAVPIPEPEAKPKRTRRRRDPATGELVNPDRMIDQATVVGVSVNGQEESAAAVRPPFKPELTEVFATATRSVQVAPYEKLEITVGVRGRPDRNYTAGENSDRLGQLMAFKADELAERIAREIKLAHG